VKERQRAKQSRRRAVVESAPRCARRVNLVRHMRVRAARHVKKCCRVTQRVRRIKVSRAGAGARPRHGQPATENRS